MQPADSSRHSVPPSPIAATTDTKWAEAFLGMPAENTDGYARTSLVRRAASCTGGYCSYMVHTMTTCTRRNTQAFIDALIKAGKLFDLMIYPMRKHDIGDRDATIHLYRTMLDFGRGNL